MLTSALKSAESSNILTSWSKIWCHTKFRTLLYNRGKFQVPAIKIVDFKNQPTDHPKSPNFVGLRYTDNWNKWKGQMDKQIFKSAHVIWKCLSQILSKQINMIKNSKILSLNLICNSEIPIFLFLKNSGSARMSDSEFASQFLKVFSKQSLISVAKN